MNLFRTTQAALALSISLVGAAIAELPQISDAHVVQPPPGSKVAAAYFTISNSSDEALEISDVVSGIADRTELHLSIVENDVAKMLKQDSVVVEAGESLEFKHGSFHIMFMGLNEAPIVGNSLDITLVTSAGDIDVSLPVISLDDAMSRSKMSHEIDMEHKMDDTNQGEKKHDTH